MIFMESLLYFLLNFFTYGFLGWILENVFCYFVKGHFQEDGFLNGPFKPMYAVAMSIMITLFSLYNNNLFLLFIGLIIPTTVEYITGVSMKKYFNKVYWDYSDVKYNYKGIVCLQFTIYWTLLTFVTIKYIQPYGIGKLYGLINNKAILIIIIFISLLCLDEIVTLRSFKII